MNIKDLSVILVEPSLTQRHIITQLLSELGISYIETFSNGTEALQALPVNKPDLVISDYNMPEMNRQELVDTIRQESGQPGLPILMVTSEPNQNRLAAVQKSGVSAICDKPFTTETIQHLLQQILQEQ
ncbi:MAG: response regulator [Candidatus Thiodiazotropha sp. (ex Lucinoma kastoroae)]|nr:response regulator [Candidatus Thiodiazotropha sp. (ex Lucinoma kastoroae)]MCU7860941.1 response regulator [Candidatus Thiodiazotropha sp. (ex Lucinoma kastoroae)]